MERSGAGRLSCGPLCVQSTLSAGVHTVVQKYGTEAVPSLKPDAAPPSGFKAVSPCGCGYEGTAALLCRVLH